MPGKKDFISVEEEKCEDIFESDWFWVIWECMVYLEFKDKIPDCKIGVSKFAELRPLNIVF